MAADTPSNLDGWGALRLALASIGGVVAGHFGIDISEGDMAGLAGALISIAMFAWGVYVRWGARSVPVAVAAAPNIPVQSDLTGKVRTGPGV